MKERDIKKNAEMTNINRDRNTDIDGKSGRGSKSHRRELQRMKQTHRKRTR